MALSTREHDEINRSYVLDFMCKKVVLFPFWSCCANPSHPQAVKDGHAVGDVIIVLGVIEGRAQHRGQYTWSGMRMR